MRHEIDFSKAVRNRHADSIPRQAVFVKFGPEVSALLEARGNLGDRLRQLASKRRSKNLVCVVVFSKREYSRLQPLISKLGGEVIYECKKPTGRKAV